MSRVYNFSAGPAVLPEPVLKEVADEMMDYQGTGMSVMEMSHRSPEFQKIIDDAEQDLRDLMNIPDNYKVLFLQGGASQQFAMIPMNLMKNGVADYIVTGQWAKKAYQEAQKYGKVNNNKKVENLSDFKGQKIRTMENSYHMAYWKNLGAGKRGNGCAAYHCRLS